MSPRRDVRGRIVSAFSDVVERARALLFRRNEERETREELAFHLDLEIRKNLSQGMTAAEARRRALISFGGVDRFTEQVREARGTLALENLARDVRLAARGLRRNPGFTAVAVLTLAIGIGATTTVFALANWLLLRPVPGVARPDELVVVSMEDAPGQSTGVSHAQIEALVAASPGVVGMTGFQSASLQVMPDEGAPYIAGGAAVQGDFFGVLGLEPHLGRFFSEEERAPAAAGDVAVVSERFWRTRLGGASGDGVGGTLALNGARYTVVGVAPPGFQGPERIAETDVWVPAAAYARLRHNPAYDALTDGIFFELVARLAPGVTVELAQEQLRAAGSALLAANPEAHDVFESHPPTVYAGIGLPILLRERTTATVRMLLGVVSLLLLIACANLANLLLFRGVSRRAEGAVRLSLGAARGRLLQHGMLEGVLLALIGSAAGLGVAMVLEGALRGQRLLALPPVPDLALDGRVLAFAVGGALLAGGFAAALPTLLALRSAPLPSMRAAEPSSAGYGAASRSLLTTVQIGASLMLLVGAVLLARSAGHLASRPLGFEARGAHLFAYDTEEQGMDGAVAKALEGPLLERIAAVPGVASASLSLGVPTMVYSSYDVTLPGREVELGASAIHVSSDYFDAAGIPLLYGRGFEPDEVGAISGVGVVLTATAAEALFGTVDVVGRTVVVDGFAAASEERVIGVTAEVRLDGLRDDPVAAVHLPLGGAPSFQSERFLLVRSGMSGPELERVIGEAFREVVPATPFFMAISLEDRVRASMAEERLLARLLGIFALLAVTLAAIGLYGVVAYSVARRQREIGLRMALGAGAASVVALVARQSLALVGAGAVLGVGGGYALSRVLASRLFGVTPLDPATYAAAVGALVVVALAASAVPASAATKLDPVRALKAE